MKFQRKMARRKHPSVSEHMQHLEEIVDPAAVNADPRLLDQYNSLPNRAAKRRWIREQIAAR